MSVKVKKSEDHYQESQEEEDEAENTKRRTS